MVLSAPGVAVQVFDATGKRLGQVPAQPVGAAAIVFGEAMDMDATGRLYVADRGANAVNVYAADGSLLAHARICAPTAIAALPRDEFAVSCLNADHLISVYDFQGTLLREFGDLADLVSDPALNHRLNSGELASDNDGNLYFAFKYLPEPTVRKFDRFGYLAQECCSQLAGVAIDSRGCPKELARADKKGTVISPHEIISGMGVDLAAQDLWISLGNLLVRFDRNAAGSGGNRAYTVDGAPLTPAFILAEPDRLLLGNDPLGICRGSPACSATMQLCFACNKTLTGANRLRSPPGSRESHVFSAHT